MEQYSSICSRLQLPRMDTRVPGGHRCCSFTREKSKRVYVCIYNTYDCSHPHQVGISLRIPYSIYLRTSGWLCTMIIIIWHTYIYIIYKHILYILFNLSALLTLPPDLLWESQATQVLSDLESRDDIPSFVVTGEHPVNLLTCPWLLWPPANYTAIVG